MMKRCILPIILCLLLALTACGRVKESPAYAPQETAAVTAPPLSKGAETESVIAGSFMADTDGTLYTTFPGTAGDAVYLYDILPQDTGYVYVFIPSGGTVYAVVRTDFMTLDSAQLCAYDTADGSCTVLADDCSGISKLILAGDTLYYEGAEGGIYSIDVSSGKAETAIADALSLFGADGGFLYYTRDDGCVYRNDSKLDSEFTVLSDYSSLLFFCSSDSICNVSYMQDSGGSIPVLQFRDASGSLKTQQVLSADVTGLCQQGGVVYAVLPADGELVGYSLADGSEVSRISLPDAEELLTLLYVSDTQVYYTTLQDGVETVTCAAIG